MWALIKKNWRNTYRVSHFALESYFYIRKLQKFDLTELIARHFRDTDILHNLQPIFPLQKYQDIEKNKYSAGCRAQK